MKILTKTNSFPRQEFVSLKLGFLGSKCESVTITLTQGWAGRFFLLPGTGIENHRNCFPGFRERTGIKNAILTGFWGWHSRLGIAGNENSRSPLLWPRPFQLQILQNASESLRKYCQKVLLKWSGVTKLYSRYFGKWENINNNSPSSSYMHSEPW